MNTVPRAITAHIFPDSDTYVALRRQWRNLIQSDQRHDLAASHHLLYLALLGKDWRKEFTPVSNQRKLENGAFYGWGLFRALALFHSQLHDQWLLEPFTEIVTPQMLATIRRLVPKVTPYAFPPEAYANKSFPFPAYDVPEPLWVTAVTDKESDHA